MTLAARIIPTLLMKGRQLVKGERFNPWRSVGLVAQAVQVHAARGVDELVLLDVAATTEGRGPDLALIEELSHTLFCPLSVGGGVRSVEDVKALLRAGADKVVIGTAAVTDLIGDAAEVSGRQAIVAAVDVKEGIARVRGGNATILGPTMDPLTACSALDWARICAAEGAGEILLTAIDREGTMSGYDLDLIRQVAVAVSIPVIAHGGCSGYEDMRLAIEAGASGVAAGALFQFTDCTPRAAARYLSAHGVEARI